MLGQGSMTGLTCDHYVFALLFLFDDIGVAGLAEIVAGEGHRPGSGFRDRSAAVVAVLSKAGWDDGNTQNHEYGQQHQDDHSEPDEMFYVLEQVRSPRQARFVILRTKQALYFDT